MVITNIDNSFKFSEVAKILEKKMIFISKNWEAIKKQALINSEIIHEKFSWRTSTEKLLNVIIETFS